jgi:hypothetical protein
MPHPFNNTFEEFMSRPYSDKSAFSNSFEDPLANPKQKKENPYPPSLVK